MRALINGRLVLEDGIYENKVVLLDQKIQAIFSKEMLPYQSDWETIDVAGNYISPGLIDIHIHGAGGSDTMDGTLDSLNIISSTIIRNGVTAFLPTTMTMEKEKIYQSLEAIRLARSQGTSGARILGAHLEGPFINPKYKGAQKEEYIIPPNPQYIEPYLDVIRIITLAPEMDDNTMSFLQPLNEKEKIVLSIGHSDARYEEAMLAIGKGITHATHIFNAMVCFHHREPGIIGAIFNSNITCELIPDKIHVHPALFPILVKVKGIENLILITDSIRAGNMADGEYDLGGQKVIVADGTSRLEDGTIAGSILTLNRGIKKFSGSYSAPPP